MSFSRSEADSFLPFNTFRWKAVASEGVTPVGAMDGMKTEGDDGGNSKSDKNVHGSSSKAIERNNEGGG